VPITVAASDASTGWALVGANTAAVPAISARFVIPNGTIISARGHYLATNNGASGYSLGGYASGDITYSTGVVDGGSIGLFNNNTAANWTIANRLDAVGFTAPAGGTASFIEGSGLTPAGGITTNGEYSFVRKMTRASGGLPQDINDNQNDFAFVSITGGVFNTLQSTLGAPGPENSTSPIQRNAGIPLSLLDPAVASSSAPNRARDLTPDPGNNSPFGTMTIRRTVTNNTAVPITRLRFRIVDITTFAGVPPGGVADLRVRTSPGPTVIAITGSNPACPANSCAVQALILETPPTQAAGGGLNSSVAAGTVSVGTPIVPGGQLNVQFLLGIQQTGSFRFLVNVEALP